MHLLVTPGFREAVAAGQLLRVLFLDRVGHISAEPHYVPRAEALILASNQQRVLGPQARVPARDFPSPCRLVPSGDWTGYKPVAPSGRCSTSPLPPIVATMAPPASGASEGGAHGKPEVGEHARSGL
jgi:hypothetical protein